MKNVFSALLLSLFFTAGFAQNVFKTPSGSKYHLAGCRTVKNVSAELTVAEALAQGLGPCGVCHPPMVAGAAIAPHKAKGQAATTYQCTATAKSTGRQCRHRTRIAGGRCFQHGG